jgi:chromosome partitioning protein
MKKQTVISIATQKGGVSKTTSAINIGAALRDSGYKVLLVDIDLQSNLTRSLYRDEVDHNVGDLMMGNSTFKETVIKTSVNLDLLPASADLANVERDLTNTESFHTQLKTALQSAKGYDFVIIDCPTGLGNMSVNALYASDYYIVPVLTDWFSIEGVKAIVNTANNIQQLNKGLDLLGVVVTRYNVNDIRTFDKQVYQQLQTVLGDKLFNTTIRQHKSIKETVVYSQDIFTYDPNSNGATDYRSLTDEILERIK